LGGDLADSTPRELLRQRQETILRLERFWALANVLARPDGSGGVRGVTYAKDCVKEISRRGDSRTTAKYGLLSRQSQYGAIGMYANVADGMRFLNREDFTLTPALGEVAAEAFLDETDLPDSLRRAVLNDTDISLSTLRDWGERAHVEGEIKLAEAKCFLDALHCDPVRSCMAGLLTLHPCRSDQETELARLARVHRTLTESGKHPGLRQAVACILNFESCYQICILAFERILWLCRHHTAACVTLAELDGDPVFQSVRDRLPIQVRGFLDTLDNGDDPAFRHDLDRLSDVRGFLEEAGASVGDIQTFIGAIISCHSDVQHGKFDRGRPKMPWIERNDSRINLTMTRAGGMNSEATIPEHITPHPYRLRAADALISASSKAVHP
jgi:hypothetical protein